MVELIGTHKVNSILYGFHFCTTVFVAPLTAIWKENRFFTAKKKTVTKAIVAELLKNGKVSLTGCYSEKTGKTYDCVAVLDDTGGQYVNFKVEFGEKEK